MDQGLDSPAPRSRRRSREEPQDFSPNRLPLLPSHRSRRRSREEPLDFSLNGQLFVSLPFSPFLDIYEDSRQRLEDIISELHQDPADKERNPQRNLHPGERWRAWTDLGLLPAQLLGWSSFSLALVLLAALGGLFPVQLLGWSSLPLALVSFAALGGVFWVVRWIKRSPDPAEERERRVQMVMELLREELTTVMEALELMERSLKKFRAEEEVQQKRRTLHRIQMNLPDAKFSINQLHLLLLRSCDRSCDEEEGGVSVGRQAVHDTLTELDQFVKLLRWTEQTYQDSESS